MLEYVDVERGQNKYDKVKGLWYLKNLDFAGT